MPGPSKLVAERHRFTLYRQSLSQDERGGTVSTLTLVGGPYKCLVIPRGADPGEQAGGERLVSRSELRFVGLKDVRQDDFLTTPQYPGVLFRVLNIEPWWAMGTMPDTFRADLITVQQGSYKLQPSAGAAHV
ncbi:MAG: hypothetical protein K2X82_30145 [Gemmataceae bacterium]|nr:hypothetical protein [Gemmataceae bacterium]